MSRTALWSAFLALGFTALVLALWQAAVHLRLANPIFVAAPLAAARVIWERLTSGALWDSVFSTTWRMLAGWVLASLVGIGLGALIGTSRLAQKLLQPTLEAFRPLPASAAIPVAILIFGLTGRMAVAVIAFGAIWPVLLSTIQGFRAIPLELREVGRMYEMSSLRFFREIALPSASVDIFAGLRISLALALILAVVTEMQASLPGVGYDIFMAQRSYRAADLYAGLLVIGLIGLALNQVLLSAEKRIFAWQRP